MTQSVGHVSFPIPGHDDGLKLYSEDTAQKIDEEANKIINLAFSRAEKVILAKMEELKKISQYLIENEVMSVEKFKEIVGERNFLDV
jgi:ATP-dependent Zn protease